MKPRFNNITEKHLTPFKYLQTLSILLLSVAEVGYLITFWIKYLNHTRKENYTSREAVHFYVFYIASFWWCNVHWCKETHLIYEEGKHICLLVITFVLLGPFLWGFAAEFLPKILFKWYLEWLCFWASTFWSCDGE